MKVLFLDIDGVLNSEQSAHYYHNLRERGEYQSSFELCPIASSNLYGVTKELKDLKIVISSSHRIGATLEELRIKLKSSIFDPFQIIDMTPVNLDCLADGGKRGSLIKSWLDTNKHLMITDYLILDDETDMGPLLHRLVKTNPRVGFDYFVKLEILNHFKAKSKLELILKWNKRITKAFLFKGRRIRRTVLYKLLGSRYWKLFNDF